ncbi:tyrosine-protein phosphatase (plasmid) [Sphingobium sp. SJ10-10]|uniref:tyrosine-protein phosphatase n=1 Tax=Sphingobium sp. SJ10-10 TaxID=3114999 RepID=UPI002E197FD2|nr:tyrosine-protein phosphatase [Sphingobium sp. SJ10-10]
MTEVGRDSGRIIFMDGGHNFRDIGGYPTRDGCHVAQGLVFRSGTMSELSDRDHAILDNLGLKVICDLRSTSERSRRPSRLPEAAQYEIWSRDHHMSAGDLTEAMHRPDATPDTVRALMIDAYRTLAYEQAPSYRELFLRIAQGPLPLVFHCAAGKDRTGIAAALLLDLLGVERERIFADYALTDEFFARGCQLIASDPVGHRFAEVDPAIWEPMMRADPAYLAAMFVALEVRHGTAEAFIRDELGLDDEDIMTIRDRLLV